MQRLYETSITLSVTVTDIPLEILMEKFSMTPLSIADFPDSSEAQPIPVQSSKIPIPAHFTRPRGPVEVIARTP